MICIYIYIIVSELFHLDPNIAIFLGKAPSLDPHGSIVALGLRAMML